MEWIIGILFFIYIVSVVVLIFTFCDDGKDGMASFFVLLCPILNTFVCVKCFRKKLGIKKFINDVKTIIKSYD